MYENQLHTRSDKKNELEMCFNTVKNMMKSPFKNCHLL